MSRPADPSLLVRLLQRCAFPARGSTVECAVSGGADSLALLALASAAGLDVTAVHVDHGLRPGSADEASVVQHAATAVGARFESRRIEVTDGPNLEARARAARYGVLAPDALTGHTLDDQAETVLLFLMRGTGPEGLAGIDPARRPLLGLRRSETRELCTELGWDVVDDPANDDRRFTRNRLRHELLPAMNEIAGRDVAPLVARAAALQRDVLAVVDAAAAGLDPTDARALAAAPAAVGAAAVRSWWRRETGSAYAPDAAAVERIIDVARGGSTATDVAAGWRVLRTSQRLRLERALGDHDVPR